ncbi:hypothetical protein KsCSTR_09130 [Candidatus Kuenenia stuttgartiensis]|uniref:Uncharacterized protein n=1 Tax=Kuenenia stuttgartiensis TaxID=174633 RepID=A0A6G7GLQ3_KUEST|nr:hypothetical protein KsCSTR_09130 [Candidatus Kuenenia stuttgartiensis]
MIRNTKQISKLSPPLSPPKGENVSPLGVQGMVVTLWRWED